VNAVQTIDDPRDVERLRRHRAQANVPDSRRVWRHLFPALPPEKMLWLARPTRQNCHAFTLNDPKWYGPDVPDHPLGWPDSVPRSHHLSAWLAALHAFIDAGQLPTRLEIAFWTDEEGYVTHSARAVGVRRGERYWDSLFGGRLLIRGHTIAELDGPVFGRGLAYVLVTATRALPPPQAGSNTRPTSAGSAGSAPSPARA
jgi:hypothetical protein